MGAPGLSTAEQLNDSINSIRWAFDNGADEVVVFPANIKPDTPLWRSYEKNEYAPPSSWLLVELLNRLTKDELCRTSVSWYGDRQHKGVDTDIIPPLSCPKCNDSLMEFYTRYMSSSDAEKRRASINAVIKESTCSSYKNLLKELRGEHHWK